ncbi:hypothetical protein DFH08DRAFT_865999 [Mycena albidolilacea]|uniref:RING-type domain-containing protein n=1 Tax=Mycena albidolilacea TaxID=1033008 RepID=A0AAD7ERT1_9AGAR|nr:hypothetical protein DFH08DRAFT_865999 [Mycena albidolilacea]
MLSRRRSGPLVSIPEESNTIGLHLALGDGYNYMLDLGSGAAQSVCPSPQPMQIRRPTPRRPATSSARRAPQKEKEPERDCGICFELAVTPVRTLCCAHLFCAEHIVAWLHGPASDGRCPSCSAPGLDILALGHPGQAHLVPPAPPPTRSPSPLPSHISTSSAPYAAYPSTPAVLPPSPSSLCPADLSSSSSSEEEEDATDYSLPALVHARAMQTRRHTPHPFSSVLGLRGALGRVGRIVVWLVLVAVLAGRGRWAS